MSALRLVSQVVLTYLCLPEHFGVVMLMRTFLTFVEMVSDMGLRNAVISHSRGEERLFLGTAASVQLVRGLGMWLLTCALAWPIGSFYGEPLLYLLLPLAGLESLNNGLYCVRSHVAERRMHLAAPALLEVLALFVSIATSIVWCWLSPGVLGLALGPLIGGCVRMLASHVYWRAERVRFAWDAAVARELFGYSRWIIGSTTVSFVAQQFHLLYLGKLLASGPLGIYGLAWNFCAQASKPMTALANKVLIPHLAEAVRGGPEALGPALRRSSARYLPACLLVCLGAGLFAPAMFGFFYEASFAEGGTLGELFAIVVWFMILQQVPRCTLLALGNSRAVASMAGWNAAVTVVGILGGYALGDGSVTGAILGNALGNVAGCCAGWLAMRALGLRLGRMLGLYSLAFLGCLGIGVAGMRLVVAQGWTSPAVASLVASVAVGLPLGAWVWRRTLGPRRARQEASGEER